METGAVWQSRSRLQFADIDNTSVDMTTLQGSGPKVHRRVELTWHMNHRHAIRFVYMPLGFSGAGTFATPVRFAGEAFPPNIPVDSDYKLDSYRLTYRYLLHESERWRWKVGATALLWDARAELRAQGLVAQESHVGAVPLLSTNVEYAIAPRWTALIDFDGLIVPQGRMLDAAAKVRYDLTDAWYVTAGYRLFDGRVDYREHMAAGRYSFAVVSLGVRF
jgi:hypothetical protein